MLYNIKKWRGKSGEVRGKSATRPSFLIPLCSPLSTLHSPLSTLTSYLLPFKGYLTNLYVFPFDLAM